MYNRYVTTKTSMLHARRGNKSCLKMIVLQNNCQVSVTLFARGPELFQI